MQPSHLPPAGALSVQPKLRTPLSHYRYAVTTIYSQFGESCQLSGDLAVRPFIHQLTDGIEPARADAEQFCVNSGIQISFPES